MGRLENTKSYANDPKKEEARQLQKEFIASHLKKDPLETRVLCLPGAERRYEEALEVKQIYDQLGIPRGNILGVENRKKPFRLLERAKLGIKLIPSDVECYLRETDRRFDIISLDYCTNLTFDVLESVGIISGRELLTPNGILVTNILGERERKYASYMMWQEKWMSDAAKQQKSPEEKVDEFARARSNSRIDNSVRDYGITQLLSHVLMSGKANIGGVPIAMASPHYEATQEFVRKFLEGIIAESEREVNIDRGEMFKRELRNFANGNFGSNAVYLQHMFNLVQRVKIMGLPSRLAFYLWEMSEAGYEATAIQRFWYKSNSGSNMFTDMMVLAPLNQLRSIREDRVKLVLGEGTVKVIMDGVTVVIYGEGSQHYSEMPRYERRAIDRVAAKIVEVMDRFTKIRVADFPERIYLGASPRFVEEKVDDTGVSTEDQKNRDLEFRADNGGYSRKKDVKRYYYITDKMVRLLLAHGFTATEIAQFGNPKKIMHYAGIASAWKRGRYGPPRIEAVLTEDNARRIMGTNITPEALNAKYQSPADSGIYSLRAYKAHKTRRIKS